MEVLDRLRNINRTSRAKSFDSFDFSTLYTNIPHEAFKTNIRNLIREAFKVRGSKYLIVSKDGKAHWSLEPSLWSACVSVDNSKGLFTSNSLQCALKRIRIECAFNPHSIHLETFHITKMQCAFSNKKIRNPRCASF